MLLFAAVIGSCEWKMECELECEPEPEWEYWEYWE